VKAIFIIGTYNICETIAGAFSEYLKNSEYCISGFIVTSGMVDNSKHNIYHPDDYNSIALDSNSFFVQPGGCYLDIPGFRLTTLIHPTAIISEKVTFGEGTVVMPKCLLYPNVTTGNNNLFMNGFKTGHDVTIGDNCFMDYNSFIGSFCSIGSGVNLGMKTTVKEYISIGRNTKVLGASVLINNIGVEEIWEGIPARKISI
jgi:acetyltransferase-like isoleucine patch superfamily enzyme